MDEDDVTKMMISNPFGHESTVYPHLMREQGFGSDDVNNGIYSQLMTSQDIMNAQGLTGATVTGPLSNPVYYGAGAVALPRANMVNFGRLIALVTGIGAIYAGNKMAKTPKDKKVGYAIEGAGMLSLALLVADIFKILGPPSPLQQYGCKWC